MKRRPSGVAGLCALIIAFGCIGCGRDGTGKQASSEPWRGPIDRSADFGAAPGVRVEQITGGVDQAHVLSYYDIAAYSPRADRIIYNGEDLTTGVWSVVSARTDGSDARTLVTRRPPAPSVTRVDLSQDGQFVSYLRLNSDDGSSFDLYGFFVGDGVTPREMRLTDRRFPADPRAAVGGDSNDEESPTDRAAPPSPAQPKAVSALRDLKTSPAALDPATGHYVVAFAVGVTVYLVRDDGRAPDGTAGPASLELADAEREQKFHRLRLDPAFPHLLLYRRDHNETAWIVDWRIPDKPVLWLDHVPSPHFIFRPDGLVVGLEVDGTWYEYTLVTPDGQLMPGLGPGTPPRRLVGTFGTPGQPPIYYGTYTADGRTLAVATDASLDAGGRIFLIDSATGMATYLTRARASDRAARLGFIGTGEALVFSTDASWNASDTAPPQLYLVTATDGTPLLN